MLEEISTEYDPELDAHITKYACSFLASCEDQMVKVTGITVCDGGDFEVIWVKHNGDLLYHDREFEHAISHALGYRVQFTEQGMQAPKSACLERI